MVENVEKFISELSKSLHEATFVKLTLGNYKGSDEHLQKILVRPVETKKGAKLFFSTATTRETRQRIMTLTKA
ncbi:MAG: hypothetical protein HC846_01445 [Blastocatellia bacterium]|nr:hypothetical protein [Blastocatellia bacterium]